MRLCVRSNPVFDVQAGDVLKVVIGSEDSQSMKAGDGGNLRVQRRDGMTGGFLLGLNASERLGGGFIKRPDDQRAR